MSIFGNRLKYVTCKTWDATQAAFSFPEQSDPQLKVDGLLDRPNLGLAFSGGGTRSASATLGQLRGLNALGLLNKARYISGVSGSSFILAPFTYLPGSWTDKTFLGPIIPPEDVTANHLKQTDRNSFSHAIANSILIDDFIKNAASLAGDETFSRTIGDNFLNRFDLDSLQRFFSYDQKSVSSILEHNAVMSASDFYQVRPGRPYLIINSLILKTSNDPPTPRRIPFESTPLYVGVRALHKGAGSNGRDIGGGYIEPFGFDSDAPDDPQNASSRVKVRLGVSRHRYTLSDVIGSSGAAPAEVLAKIGLNFLGFPEFKYWPLTNISETGEKEYEFADGGILENLAIMPLLMRKVNRIIVFINTKDELLGGELGRINNSIPPLFGQTPGFDTNIVFPKAKYQALVDGLKAAKDAGKSVLFKDKYQVQDNAHYGVEGGWEVEVLWVYNECVPAWKAQLPARIRNMIGSGSLSNFPHYRTFMQNPPALIDLSAKQTFMLAHLSCWNVINNDDLFQSMLA